MGSVALPSRGLVGLDSAPLIYVVEKHPLYGPPLAPLWSAAKRGELTLVLSELALSEAMVVPIREADASVIQAYEAIIEEPGFRVVLISWPILRRAAELRATRPGLRSPDAIHIATAEHTGCDAFVTNDKSLRTAPLPNIIVVDDLLPS